jgi:hypothetical protein
LLGVSLAAVLSCSDSPTEAPCNLNDVNGLFRGVLYQTVDPFPKGENQFEMRIKTIGCAVEGTYTDLEDGETGTLSGDFWRGYLRLEFKRNYCTRTGTFLLENGRIQGRLYFLCIYHGSESIHLEKVCP